MVKFVWLDMKDGGRNPVNPDQVQYVRMTQEGDTAVVFGAVSGGMHQLLVKGSGDAVAKALEGDPAALEAQTARKPLAKRLKGRAAA